VVKSINQSGAGGLARRGRFLLKLLHPSVASSALRGGERAVLAGTSIQLANDQAHR